MDIMSSSWKNHHNFYALAKKSKGSLLLKPHTHTLEFQLEIYSVLYSLEKLDPRRALILHTDPIMRHD